MNPLIVSFYTLGTPYEEEARRLIHSCQMWGIESDVVGIDSRGTWEKNCALKPFFIAKKLKQWKRSLLWVDADAIFKQRPDFNEFQACDIAVRVNEFLPSNHESRIVSNTIFIRNNLAGRELLENWCQKTDRELGNRDRIMEFWDQTALRDVLTDNTHARFLPMPLKYAKIFDFDDLFISEQEVVIEHYQASRRHKNKIHANFPRHCCQ